LLEEAGWKRNAQGGLEKNGQRFQFTLMTNQGNKLRSLAAEIIQRELKAIGVDVEIRILEWSTFIRQYVDTHEFDAIILGWNTARDPDIYSMWHSSQRMPGQYNFTSYSNPEVDRLLVEGRQTFDHQKRQTIYHQLHAKIAADVPYIFLYSPDKLLAFHKRFRGIEVAPAGIGWNFREWDVPEGKERYPARVSYEP
jgi:peptide/nickel transport system substrate-binding protein